MDFYFLCATAIEVLGKSYSDWWLFTLAEVDPFFQQSSTLMVHLANRQLHGDRVGRAVDSRVCRILKIGCIIAILKTIWTLKIVMLL